MKEISKKKLSTKIRKAYKEGRDWCSYGHFRTYTIMIDSDDADIWTDCFLDCNSWTEYYSSTIASLSVPWIYDCETVKEREEEYLKEAIRILTKAGWTVTE